MKYAIVNLGCKVNAFEAEAVSEMLSNNGHTRVSFDEQNSQMLQLYLRVQ